MAQWTLNLFLFFAACHSVHVWSENKKEQETVTSTSVFRVNLPFKRQWICLCLPLRAKLTSAVQSRSDDQSRASPLHAGRASPPSPPPPWPCSAHRLPARSSCSPVWFLSVTWCGGGPATTRPWSPRSGPCTDRGAPAAAAGWWGPGRTPPSGRRRWPTGGVPSSHRWSSWPPRRPLRRARRSPTGPRPRLLQRTYKDRPVSWVLTGRVTREGTSVWRLASQIK